MRNGNHMVDYEDDAQDEKQKLECGCKEKRCECDEEEVQ